MNGWVNGEPAYIEMDGEGFPDVSALGGFAAAALISVAYFSMIALVVCKDAIFDTHRNGSN